MNSFSLIPYYSLRPNQISFYSRPDENYCYARQKIGWKNLENNQNKTGKLSQNAQKRLRRKIEWMLFTSKKKEISGRVVHGKYQGYTTHYSKGNNYQSKIQYKLTFITLTLPSKQIHSDKEIKSKCLNQFLVELRSKFNVKKYIWKAEKQKNGNIHFHILCDRYIQWHALRNLWNRIVNKLGYVNVYQTKMKNFYKNGFRLSNNPLDNRPKEVQLKAFNQGLKSDWSNPNSTDIHALYKVKNLSSYMSKYLVKDGEKIEGRIWGCSQFLSKCSALIDVGHQYSLKVFDEIKRVYSSIFSVKHGSAEVTTVFFDISKTPGVYALLHQHVAGFP